MTAGKKTTYHNDAPNLSNTANTLTGFLLNEEFYTTERGEVSFGLVCGSTVNIDFTTTATDPLITTQFYLSFWVDDVIVDSFTMGASATASRAIPFVAAPCGTILTILCLCGSLADPGVPTLFANCSFTITSIT